MPLTPNQDRPAWHTWAVCATLVLGTVALFSRALPYDFTNFDDLSYLLNNPHVRAGLTWSSVHWAFTGATDYWHPLTWLSHMLDWELYEANASGHRMTSILWHAGNAVLVFLFLRRLTGAWWTSALCAALFAWHPLRVESVVWMPERKDVMSGFFFLLCLWAYVRYAEKRDTRAAGVRGAYGLSLAMFLGALMSKPVMVALPCVLVMLDFWPLRRWPTPVASEAFADPGKAVPWWVLGREKVPFFALSGIVGVVTLLMQHEVGALTSLSLPLTDRIGNALVALPRYLADFFWPFNLAVIYPHPGEWPVGLVAFSAAIVAAITALAISQWRRRPWIAVGWGWFLVMLAPSIGIIQAGLQARADRYTYVPVIGLQLALLWVVRDRFPRPTRRWIPFVAAVFVMGAISLRTWDQQKVWRSSTALFAHALGVTKDNYAAHAFYGLTVLNEGRIEEAETHTLRSIAIKSDSAIAYDVLAVIRSSQGRLDEAIACLDRVLELKPRLARAHSDIASLRWSQGRYEEAEASWQAALALNAELAAAHVGLGNLASLRGATQEAINHLARAVALAPQNVEARNNLAAILGPAGRFDEAGAHYEAALEIAPGWAELRYNYAAMLRAAGRAAEAAEQSRAAIGLQPDAPLFHVSLALDLEQLERFDEAIAAYQEALRVSPGFAPAHCGWGMILLRRRETEAARRQFDIALLHDPQSGAAHGGLAVVAQQTGRWADAVTHARRALAIDDRDAGMWRQLGDALIRLDQVADAAASYERAVRLRPNEAELHARLGFTLMIMKRPADAIQAWENALRLAPNFPDLRDRIAQARQQIAREP